MPIQGSSWRNRLRDWARIAAIDEAWRRFPSLNTSYGAHAITLTEQVTSNPRRLYMTMTTFVLFVPFPFAPPIQTYQCSTSPKDTQPQLPHTTDITYSKTATFYKTVAFCGPPLRQASRFALDATHPVLLLIHSE